MANRQKTIDIVVKDIDSSVIKFLHYHSKNGVGNLGVTFTNETSYIYGRVRLQSFLNVLASTSVGEAFNKYIKGSYSFRQVDDCNGESPLSINGMT